MQVDTNVSESDIGGVKIGDRATFTVQTFPNRQFEGAVRQVRQAPTTVQNVVTYDVVVAVDNRDGALKPGMTATTRDRQGRAGQRAPASRAGAPLSAGGCPGRPAGRRPRRSERSASARAAAPAVVAPGCSRDGKPAAVPLVRSGSNDGTSAEIAKGELAEGDQVIVAEATTGTKGGAGAGQAPRFFRPGGGR